MGSNSEPPSVELQGWARRRKVTSGICRPTNVPEIRELLSYAQEHDRSVVPRGAGHSCFDAALNAEGIVLDLSQMRRLELQPEREIIRVEPGVTIGDLCRSAVVEGCWPEVLPSGMDATVGGCLAMNVHGTNAWKKGSFGEYVAGFELLLASGEQVEVTLAQNPDLYYSVIGGLGMLGVITSITLQLRRIHSDELQVSQHIAPSLADMFAIFAEESPRADYLVGWIDGYAEGRFLGRGIVTSANYIEEPDPPSWQSGMPGLIARAAETIPPEAVRLLLHESTGVKFGNTMYYNLSVLHSSKYPLRMSMTQFHFRFDPLQRLLPSMLPQGGSFFHAFVPARYAPTVFAQLLELSQQRGLVPFWCNIKQHRADPFRLSYQVDGFSLELAYRVTPQNETRLAELLREMLEPVIRAEGRLYLAKDDILDAQSYRRSMDEANIKRFLKIKEEYDPDMRFQSDLFRRLFR